MSDDVFIRYGSYYDLLYQDKDYDAEAAYVAQRIRHSLPGATTILELGSGTGRHGRLLAQKGFSIIGIERSGAMVAAAHQSALTDAASVGAFESIQGDITQVRLGRMFDAVISLFHVVSYQTSNGEARDTFMTAADHLTKDGIFIFDVWHGPAVLTERPTVRVKRVEDKRTRLIRIAEPELDVQSNTVLVRYSIFADARRDDRRETFGEEHRMRYFFPTEIALLAELSGFTIEHTEEFLTGAQPSDRTWGVLYVLRKT